MPLSKNITLTSKKKYDFENFLRAEGQADQNYSSKPHENL